MPLDVSKVLVVSISSGALFDAKLKPKKRTYGWKVL